jgi:hypothetical protein
MSNQDYRLNFQIWNHLTTNQLQLLWQAIFQKYLSQNQIRSIRNAHYGRVLNYWRESIFEYWDIWMFQNGSTVIIWEQDWKENTKTTLHEWLQTQICRWNKQIKRRMKNCFALVQNIYLCILLAEQQRLVETSVTWLRSRAVKSKLETAWEDIQNEMIQFAEIFTWASWILELSFLFFTKTT